MRNLADRILSRGGRYLGPVLFALSLLVYLFMLKPFPFPGESARLMVQHTGLDPFPPMSHFLWQHIALLVAALPWPGLVLRLNLLSAVCGAAAVWLLYEITRRLPHNRTAEEVESRFPQEPLQTLSAIVAAVVLAFCAPFWVVSTRAHTAPLDVLWLLLVTHLLVLYYRDHRIGRIYAFAFLYGLGTTEFATFIVLAPFFAAVAGFGMWRGGRFTARAILLGLLCYLAGLSLYFLAAWEYRRSPAYEWRQFSSYFQIVWFMWREQYRAIRFSLPQVGWLMVFVVTTLPWLSVVVFPKRAMTRSAVWGSNFLHGLLGLLGLLILFNAPIAPWPMMGLQPLLVTPYLLTASWVGYLAGYWYLFFAQRSRFEPRSTARLREIGHRLYLPALCAALLASVWLNSRLVDQSSGQALNQFVGEVVRRLDGRTWLISNGVLDDLIALTAREKGVPVRILNVGQGGADPYMRYVATLFETPRLKGLAQIGLIPLLNEWLAETPGIERDVAVLAAPDLWLTAGLIPVPDRVLFLGSTNTAALDPEAILAAQQEYGNGGGARIRDAAARNDLLTGWNRWVLTHVGKVANNTGVLLEDLRRTDLAYEAYRDARILDTNNVSALLNMISVARRENRPEQPELDKQFQSFVGRLKGKLPVWSLATYYGYVRDPEAFAGRGWAWAMSGKPGLAIQEMQRAVLLGADKQRAEMAMAAFYFMDQNDPESERMYADLLRQNPSNQVAMLGMARLAARKGDFDTARGYLDALQKLGVPDALVRVERGVMELLEGKVPDAKATLNKLVEDDPKNLRAWTILAIIAAEEKDLKAIERCITVLKPAAANSPGILLTMAQVAVSGNDLAGARKYLEEMLQIQPSNQQALELILQLDIWEAQRGMAEEHMDRLLNLDPKNALANLVLGSLQYAREEYELAEASYRTSLASRKSTRALNDLAWILQKKGRYEEALKLVREAIEMDQNHAAAWDTMGVISMQLARLDEAQSALERALSFQPDNPHFILHMAQLYERKKMRDESLRLADPLLARAVDMSPETYEELRALMRKLRTTTY